MAQVQFPFEDLSALVKVTKQEAIETLTMLGFPTEETDEGELDIEVTPNRPDALCVEGLARVLKCYKTAKPDEYKLSKPKIEICVDKSVEKVRPAFGGAVVREMKITDSNLRSIMQIQEKLHETLGRKRRKVAIGIYDFDKTAPPFRYFACKRDALSFVPLEKQEKMTPGQILEKHEKGRAYAHLVGDMCPMIEDKNKQVLSFPPIINGESTRLTEHTKNLFVEATGTSHGAVKQTVNIIAAMFEDMGGKVEEVAVDGKHYRLLQEKKWPLPVAGSEKLLGIKLGRKKVALLLAKMGHRISGNFAYVPGYRTDVMNEVDLIEDVAIAYGFNNFEPSLPGFSSVGRVDEEPLYHEILGGLGFDEVLTWTLSNEKLEKKAGLPEGPAAEIENPLTGDFTIFRRSMLPNLLSVLSESKNEKLPIRIYEIGPTARPQLEQILCLATMHSKASFSEIKGIVLSLAESAGKKATVKKEEYGAFVKGRCAALYIGSKKAGMFGEISPSVLSEFNLEQPVCAAEMKI